MSGFVLGQLFVSLLYLLLEPRQFFDCQLFREEKISMATGDSRRFILQYNEYKKAPAITRKRIYLETMEEVLPSMQKFVMGNNKQGVLPILSLLNGIPLQSVVVQYAFGCKSSWRFLVAGQFASSELRPFGSHILLLFYSPLSSPSP